MYGMVWYGMVWYGMVWYGIDMYFELFCLIDWRYDTIICTCTCACPESGSVCIMHEVTIERYFDENENEKLQKIELHSRKQQNERTIP